MIMNEQRLVTLILTVLLVFGAAGLVVVYFTTDDRMNIGSGPASLKRTKTDLPDKTAKQSSSPSDAVFRVAVVVPADKSEKETATTSKSEAVAPGTSPAKLTGPESIEEMSAEKVPSARVPGSHDVVVLKDQPGKEPADFPSKSLNITIHEIPKSNGSCKSAQEVTEGIIIGKRGAEGDRSDFYKVRATGKTMIFWVEPVLKKKNQRFAMTVFNANKNPVRQDSRKNGRAISLAVTPESTYYIKLDLRHAPVTQKPQYKLNVKFE